MATARVSQAMKRMGVLGAVAIGGLAFWYLQRPRTPPAAADAPLPVTRAAAPTVRPTGAAPATGHAPAAVSTVTRLPTLDQRRVLAERIASAQAAHAATHAPAPPRLPDEDGSRITRTDLRQAMRELIPHLGECYEQARPTLASPEIEVATHLQLTGDPDVGTLIDADEITDRTTGEALPAAFADCLRTNLQLMALPPLAEGDKLEVNYPFRFAPI